MLYPILAALAPAIIGAIYIYTRDKSAPEPAKLLLKAFGYGVVSIGVTMLIVAPLSYMGIVPDEIRSFGDSVTTSFLGAAIPEEVAKFLMLMLLLKKHRNEFDQYIDAVVYAAFVALGFAAIENIMYVIGSEDWTTVAVTRALLAVPGHMLYGVIMGYYVSLALFMPQRKGHYLTLAVAVPVLAHGFYDVMALSSGVIDEGLALVMMALLIFFVSRLWKHCIKIIKRHNEADQKAKAEAEAAEEEERKLDSANNNIYKNDCYGGK